MPTGCLPKSAPAASTASFGTTEAKFSAITCRKVASGRESSILTVEGSTTVTPSSVLAEPSAIASKPLIEPKKPAPGDWVAGRVTRSSEYFTSSAVISRPLWNFTPGRSLNV